MSEGVRDCKKFGNHCSTPSLSFLSLLLFPCLSLLLPSSLPPSLYHSFSLCSSRLPPVFLSLHLFFHPFHLFALSPTLSSLIRCSQLPPSSSLSPSLSLFLSLFSHALSLSSPLSLSLSFSPMLPSASVTNVILKAEGTAFYTNSGDTLIKCDGMLFVRESTR